jgi:hypothetical protein
MGLNMMASKYANQHGIDPNLFGRLVNQESGWNPSARSPKGAFGLTQAMPDTARDPGFGVSPLTNVEDPNEQLRFGAEYYGAMRGRYNGDDRRALVAYNWGPGNADEWDGNLDSLPEETRNYVETILGGQGSGMLSGSGPNMPMPDRLQDQDYTVPDDFWGKIFPDQSKGEQGWLKSKIAPEMSNSAYGDRLLALGSGLLSGDDWASGLGAAYDNMRGVMNQENQTRDEVNGINAQWDWKEDQSNRDRAYRSAEREKDRASMETRQQNAGSYSRPFSIFGRDPETGDEMVLAGKIQNGEYMVPNPEGEGWVPAGSIMKDWNIAGRGARPAVEEGAGGIPNAAYVSEKGVPSFEFRREGEQKVYTYTRRAIQATRDIEKVTEYMTPEQMTSLDTGLRRWASQNAQQSVTGSTLNAILEDAGVTGIAQSAMSQYLQAVLRNDTGAAYTGVEIGDYGAAFLPNPGDDPATVRFKEQTRRNQLKAMAGSAGSAAPYLLGVIDDQYDLGNEQFDWATLGQPESGVLDSSNADNKPQLQLAPHIEDILRQQGL